MRSLSKTTLLILELWFFFFSSQSNRKVLFLKISAFSGLVNFMDNEVIGGVLVNADFNDTVLPFIHTPVVDGGGC